MGRKATKSDCGGCREDFYNRDGNSTTGECWLLKAARMVRKWSIHWWTSPVQAGAFVEVEVPSCYNQPGQFQYRDRLPEHAVEPQRMQSR